MKLKVIAMMAAVAAVSCVANPNKETVVNSTNESIYSIEVERIGGETVTLDAYKGKVLLIVNTASKCGFTGQYDGLEKLYKEYEPQGLVVLGFPSNNFLRQEPGTNEDIATFCKLNYGVTFPLFAKINVKGKEQHPLYKLLTSDPEHGKKISWNFNKYLVGTDGQILAYFGSKTKPDDKQLVEAIEAALKK